MISLASAGGTLVLAADVGRISDSAIRRPNDNARWWITRRVNTDDTQPRRSLLRAWRVRLSWRDDDPWHRPGARWFFQPGRLRQPVQPQKPGRKIGVAPSKRLRKCFLGQIGRALIHSRSCAAASLEMLAQELCAAPGFRFSNLAIVNFKSGHEGSKRASA